MAQVKAVFGTIDVLLTTIFWGVGPSSQCKKEGRREDKFCGTTSATWGTTSAGQVTHGVTEEKLKKSTTSDLRNIRVRRKPQSNVFSMEPSPSRQSNRSTSEFRRPMPNPKDHTTTHRGNHGTTSDWTTLGPAHAGPKCFYLLHLHLSD